MRFSSSTAHSCRRRRETEDQDEPAKTTAESIHRQHAIASLEIERTLLTWVSARAGTAIEAGRVRVTATGRVIVPTSLVLQQRPRVALQHKPLQRLLLVQRLLACLHQAPSGVAAGEAE